MLPVLCIDCRRTEQDSCGPDRSSIHVWSTFLVKACKHDRQGLLISDNAMQSPHVARLCKSLKISSFEQERLLIVEGYICGFLPVLHESFPQRPAEQTMALETHPLNWDLRPRYGLLDL